MNIEERQKVLYSFWIGVLTAATAAAYGVYAQVPLIYAFFVIPPGFIVSILLALWKPARKAKGTVASI